MVVVLVVSIHGAGRNPRVVFPREALLRLTLRRMDLDRQRSSRGQHLEEVRQATEPGDDIAPQDLLTPFVEQNIQGDAPVGQNRLGGKMAVRSHPELGEGLVLRILDAEESRDELRLSPGVVLHARPEEDRIRLLSERLDAHTR